MKKLLLLIAVGFIGITQASAQCTPDPQFTQAGIFPDSATGFASGCVGVQYDQLITVVVPVDTCVQVVPPPLPCTTLAFDSIVIVDFQGLPASLSYACWSPAGSNCSFPGGSAGCATISGMPTAGDIGTHNLVITVDVYVGGLGTPSAQEVIDWYFIQIDDCASGIGEISKNGVSLYPNPAENTIHLSNVFGEIVTISNVNGQLMKTISVNGNGELKVDVSELANGVYFVQVGNDTIRFVKK